MITKHDIRKAMKSPSDGCDFVKHATDQSLVVMFEYNSSHRLDWLPFLINIEQWRRTANILDRNRRHRKTRKLYSRDEVHDQKLDTIGEALEIVKQKLVGAAI